jgi:hypothetical protein
MPSLQRLDVDIGRVVPRRLGQQRVDHPDDRRVVLRFQQVLDLRDVLHQPRQIEVAAHLIDHRGGRTFLLRVRARDGRGQLRPVLSNRHQPERQVAGQFGQGAQRRRLTDPDFHGIAADAGDQHLVGPGETVGDVTRRGYGGHGDDVACD